MIARKTLSQLLVLMILFVTQFAQAQSGNKKYLKDYEKLVYLIEAHPDPYLYVSEEEFEEHINRQKELLKNAQNDFDFYKASASTLALLKDGHSRLYMPDDFILRLHKSEGAFPYKIHLGDDLKCYVVEHLGPNLAIPKGAEILSIEDRSIMELVGELDQYVSYELLHFRNVKIEQSFELYLYLLFGKTDGLKVEFQHMSKGEVIVRNVEFKDYRDTGRELRTERELALKEGRPYSYKKITKGIGLLSIYAFSVADLDDYEIFLNRSFKNIAKDSIHSLIIDVRGNFGGWPRISAELFHYISDGHFKTMAASSAKISGPYTSYLKRFIPSYIHPGAIIQADYKYSINLKALLNGKKGTMIPEAGLYNEEPKDKKYEYKGDLYCLIDRRSYSAASSFASTFQCYQMGLLVGEPTGGTKVFHANALWSQLPRTAFRVAMSTTKKFSACFDQEFQSVIPNIEVKPTILDIVHNSDAVLNFTVQLIRRQRKKK